MYILRWNRSHSSYYTDKRRQWNWNSVYNSYKLYYIRSIGKSFKPVSSAILININF